MLRDRPWRAYAGTLDVARLAAVIDTCASISRRHRACTAMMTRTAVAWFDPKSRRNGSAAPDIGSRCRWGPSRVARIDTKALLEAVARAGARPAKRPLMQPLSIVHTRLCAGRA